MLALEDGEGRGGYRGGRENRMGREGGRVGGREGNPMLMRAVLAR